MASGTIQSPTKQLEAIPITLNSGVGYASWGGWANCYRIGNIGIFTYSGINFTAAHNSEYLTATLSLGASRPVATVANGSAGSGSSSSSYHAAISSNGHINFGGVKTGVDYMGNMVFLIED